MAAKMKISDIDFLNVIPQWDNSKDDLTFGLRGVDEHRNLSVDQFELGKDQTGSYYIIQGQSQQNVQRRPLDKGSIKFGEQSVGVNKLSNIMKTMCAEAGIDGYFTNLVKGHVPQHYTRQESQNKK
ncbi:Hypothetical predicted protein [Mytilus galloprovincialis]|uniref:Uncharacterized protein n=1 Tax=Mytilus galloprovincialis TaxID=29158 RepID=A0A8B6EYZ9_MYTGA|nr:Hypothetical predicted protein [Mytilus galloprovincialis]